MLRKLIQIWPRLKDQGLNAEEYRLNEAWDKSTQLSYPVSVLQTNSGNWGCPLLLKNNLPQHRGKN